MIFNMRYGVVLGGTEFQLGLAEAITKRGLQPLILDRDKNCFLSKKYKKYFIQADISNPNQCLALVKNFDVKGCFTAQSDVGVRSQGFINSKLNLDGISYEDSLLVSNKFLFREYMDNANIKQPKYLKCENKNDIKKAFKKIGSPLIIKPVDSSGSRGISVIKDISQSESAIKKVNLFSREVYFIAEEFIDGIEFGAQVISTNGKVNYLFVHTDWTINNVPVGHSMPLDCNEEEVKNLYQLTEKAIKALQYTGPSNVDLILDKNGNVFVIEIGARIGATCLPDLVKMSTGLDLYQIQVDLALGLLTLGDNLKPNQIRSGVRIISSNEELCISNKDISKIKSELQKIKSEFKLKELNLDFNKGIGKIPKLKSGVDRFGYMHMLDNNLSSSEIQSKLDHINNVIINLFKRKSVKN